MSPVSRIAADPQRWVPAQLGLASGRMRRWSAAAVFLLCTTYVYALLWLALAAGGISLVGGLSPAIIVSDSMAPLIRTGDVVLSATSPEDIAPGDVVVYQRPGFDEALITHRVVTVDEAWITTKGDANSVADSTAVNRADIAGIGRTLVPFIGLPVTWMSGGEWLLLGLWVGFTTAAIVAVSGYSSSRIRVRLPHLLPGSSTGSPQPEPPPLARESTTKAVTTATLAILLLAVTAIGGSSAAAFMDATANADSSFAAMEWDFVEAVDAGVAFTCAVKRESSVWCWGKNDKGQLGDGTKDDSLVPLQVSGPGGTGSLGNVQTIVTGTNYVCALKNDSTVWCWGSNSEGQLGDGTKDDALTPLQVAGPGGSGYLAGAKSLAAGLTHTCAALIDGSAWCWGKNSDGQLGDGVQIDSLVPVQVVGASGIGHLAGVQSVSIGEKHTCANDSSGNAWCWGKNDKGQLGDNSTTDSDTPVQVTDGSAALSSVASISTTLTSSCAVKQDGTVWCWGENNKGQLGDNSNTDSIVAVQTVDGTGGYLTGVDGIGSGIAWFCATQAGTLWCWGQNSDGQLGDGSTDDSAIPVQVVGSGGVGVLGGATDVAGGDKHTCAPRSDRTLWCWGRNDKDQLGDGTGTDSETPVQVAFP